MLDSHVKDICMAFGSGLKELRLGSSDTGELGRSLSRGDAFLSVCSAAKKESTV